MATNFITDKIKKYFNLNINDGLATLSKYWISKNATNNTPDRRLHDNELIEWFETGIMSKIIRIKTEGALSNNLVFDDDKDKIKFDEILSDNIKQAVKYMLGFGRGILVLYYNGDNLSEPFKKREGGELKSKVFSGNIARGIVGDITRDFMNERFLKPEKYQIYQTIVHYSRVIDFTYQRPVEVNLPLYNHGGISETELVYPQLVNDSIIQKASTSLLDKASTFVYKLTGFKEQLQRKNEQGIVDYVALSEEMRGNNGALIIDKDDDVTSIAQSLTNLHEIDEVSLRRIAMITGIPLAILVGENVKGLNSTGENELKIFYDMLQGLYSNFIKHRLDEACKIFDIKPPTYTDKFNGTASQMIDYEAKIIINAVNLASLSEDYEKYLSEKGIVSKNNLMEKHFPDE